MRLSWAIAIAASLVVATPNSGAERSRVTVSRPSPVTPPLRPAARSQVQPHGARLRAHSMPPKVGSKHRQTKPEAKASAHRRSKRRRAFTSATENVREVSKAVRRNSIVVHAHGTTAVDKLERSVGPLLRTIIHRLRLFNPLHMLAYTAKVVKSDPKFLVSYAVGSAVISNLATPALLALGAGPTAAFLARFASMPLDISVILGRQIFLKRQTLPTITIGQALSQLLGSDYRSFVDHRQNRARRIMRRHQHRSARTSQPALAIP